jgi:hypothetical protein
MVRTFSAPFIVFAGSIRSPLSRHVISVRDVERVVVLAFGDAASSASRTLHVEFYGDQ